VHQDILQQQLAASPHISDTGVYISGGTVAGDGGRGGEEAQEAEEVEEGERKAHPLSCQPFHALLYAQLAPELVLAAALVEAQRDYQPTARQLLANCWLTASC
jgi:hypothetical protein